MNKAQKIAAATIQKRAGIDKAKIAAQLDPESTQPTQELVPSDWTNMIPQLMEEDKSTEEDEPLLDEDDDEAFNAQAEELFLEKLDSWFAEYAPKLFDLALAKYLVKKEKRETKADPSATSRPPKKRRT